MADDKKPVKQGVSDTVTLIKELNKGGVSEEDWAHIKKIKVEVEKKDGPIPKTDLTGIGMADTDWGNFIKAETVTEHGKLLAGDFSPTAVFGKPDLERVEKAGDFDYAGRIAAYTPGIISGRKTLQESDEWKKAGNYQLGGGTILGTAAMLGVPALALVGLLLHGHGSGMKRDMNKSFNDGVSKLLDDDNDPTGIEKRTINDNLNTAVANVKNAPIETRATVIEAEWRRLNALHPGDITREQFDASISAGETAPQTPEETKDVFEQKNIKTETDKAATGVRKQITARREESDDTETLGYMEKSNMPAAMDANYNSLTNISGSEYSKEVAFFERFSLDKPAEMNKVADIDGSSKFFHRTKPVDEMLEMMLGKVTPERAMTPGEITDEEFTDLGIPARSAVRTGVDAKGPVVKLASQYLWWMIQKGIWNKVDGGYTYSVPTFFSKTGDTYSRVKAGSAVPITDRVFQSKSLVALYSALDSDGLSETLKQTIFAKVKGFR